METYEELIILHTRVYDADGNLKYEETRESVGLSRSPDTGGSTPATPVKGVGERGEGKRGETQDHGEGLLRQGD